MLISENLLGLLLNLGGGGGLLASGGPGGERLGGVGSSSLGTEEGGGTGNGNLGKEDRSSVSAIPSFLSFLLPFLFLASPSHIPCSTTRSSSSKAVGQGMEENKECLGVMDVPCQHRDPPTWKM